MDCKMSDMLIMKYMDGDIDENEAKLLNSHILTCEACRKEFYFYDSMIKNFEAMPEIEAPQNFEVEVMAKIETLNENYAQVQYKVEHKLFGTVVAAFSVVIGGGIALYAFRKPILNAVSGGMIPESVYGKLVDMSLVAEEFVGMIAASFSGVFGNTTGAAAILMAVVAVLVVAAVALQGVYFYRKKR